MYYQKKSISTILRQYSESNFTYIRLKCEKTDYFEYLAQISRFTESEKINILYQIKTGLWIYACTIRKSQFLHFCVNIQKVVSLTFG